MEETDFKYLTLEDEDNTKTVREFNTERVQLEIAYQLKRIADIMKKEWLDKKSPF